MNYLLDNHQFEPYHINYCIGGIQMITDNRVFPLSLILAIIVVAGCAGQHLPLEIRNPQDSTPPVFTDLQFPQDNDVLYEGELVITGTLVDYADQGEPGFSEDCPVKLFVEVVGSTGALATYWSCAKQYTEDDPDFFDYETGEFRIEFGDYQRLKPGTYNLILIGEDASQNQSDPVTASVTCTRLTGLDPDLIYDARTEYGTSIYDVLAAYRDCLAVYGQQYSADIAIINELLQYIRDTYINSPEMDTWLAEAEELAQAIEALPYSNPVIKAAIDTAVWDFVDKVEEHITRKAYPWYPRGKTANEILALHAYVAAHYTDDELIIEYPTPQPASGITVHITIDTYDFLSDGQMTPIADFTIVADAEEDLEITGFIGSSLRRYYIDPEDYDPPIELLAFFEYAAIRSAIAKFW